MIRRVTQGDYADIALLIVNNEGENQETTGLVSKLRRSLDRIRHGAIDKLLCTLYKTLVERHVRLPDAQAKRDLRTLLKGVPAIDVIPTQTRWSDYFPNDAITEILKYDLDILLRCGFRILRGDVLKAAKYGIWSFHHGDNHVNRGGPPGFWECMESWPETGSILQILTDDLDNGRVLCRSFSCTDDMSLRDNHSNYFWKSLSFVPRKMEELHKRGEEEFFKNVDHSNRHPVFYSHRLYTAPTSAQLARLTLSKVAQKAKLSLRSRFFHDQWFLMFHIKDGFSSSLWRYRKIIPPRDRFWADPHIVYRDGKYYIYIEEYIYASAKGHISLIVMHEDGSYEEPIVVLNRPYHLSYPFVFAHEGQLYMIPESASNHTIQLYKCVTFPSCWEWQMNLIEDITAVDATVIRYNGVWWMFAGVAENPGASASDELFLFSNQDLLSGKWKSHPRNPIVSDCKSARPAGKIFEAGSRLYRPSQNCSVRYGYGFNISHIEVLDPQNYQEEIVCRVEPNWDKSIIATHTFNRVHCLHMIDAQERRLK